jgi:hypothetical protein
MPILQFNTQNIGQDGVIPRRVTLVSNDDYDTVTAAGYINAQAATLGLQLFPSDEVVMYYGNVAANDGEVGIFNPNIVGGVVTLVNVATSSEVIFPVSDGNLPVFQGTEGDIADSDIAAANVATAAFNFTSGHFVAGGGANKTLVDSGIALGNAVTAASAFAAAGNVVLAGGNNKTLEDSGISMIVGVDNWDGGGTTRVVSVPGCTAGSLVFANLMNHTNPAYVNADSATDTITLFFSANPGAGTQTSYLVFSGALALQSFLSKYASNDAELKETA